MNLGSKWVEGIHPEGSVAEAAKLSLSSRLEAVSHWLPLAAAQAEQDVEYVHQLRVSTRRAVAALRLYCDWLPAKKSRWVKKRLKKIRRAAGAARDLDVLAERFRRELSDGGSQLLDEIASRRAAAQPVIVKIDEHLRHEDRLIRHVRQLLDRIRPRNGKANKAQQPSDFRSWARERLAETAIGFFAAIPSDMSDTAALHQLRIRGKALRYAIELLAPAFGPELRSEHYPVVEELQERLGKINDHVVGARHLREWSAATSGEGNKLALDQLVRRDTARLAEQIQAFHEWWTSERVDSLRCGLSAKSDSAGNNSY
jgi:CHAD domain-containing protein